MVQRNEQKTKTKFIRQAQTATTSPKRKKNNTNNNTIWLIRCRIDLCSRFCSYHFVLRHTIRPALEYLCLTKLFNNEQLNITNSLKDTHTQNMPHMTTINTIVDNDGGPQLSWPEATPCAHYKMNCLMVQWSNCLYLFNYNTLHLRWWGLSFCIAGDWNIWSVKTFWGFFFLQKYCYVIWIQSIIEYKIIKFCQIDIDQKDQLLYHHNCMWNAVAAGTPKAQISWW